MRSPEEILKWMDIDEWVLKDSLQSSVQISHQLIPLNALQETAHYFVIVDEALRWQDRPARQAIKTHMIHNILKALAWPLEATQEILFSSTTHPSLTPIDLTQCASQFPVLVFAKDIEVNVYPHLKFLFFPDLDTLIDFPEQKRQVWAQLKAYKVN